MTTEAHDPKRDYMLKGPDGKSFRCSGRTGVRSDMLAQSFVGGSECGCNVFRKPDPARPNYYVCNACGTGWRNDPE